MSASITHGQNENYSLVTKWGSYGTNDSQFIRPCAVAVDPSGNIFVVDSGNICIKKFDSDGNFIKKWGSYGTGDGSYGTDDYQFGEPIGIAVDKTGNVFVLDTMHSVVKKYDNDGNFVTSWGGDSGILVQGSNGVEWQTPYNSEDNARLFLDPQGIAVDSSGNVYVADTANCRIQKFNNNGIFLAKWGGLIDGKLDTRLGAPRGIAVDSSGNIYITDIDKFCVKKLDSNGNLIAQWGSRGSGDNQFEYPTGIAVDSSNNFYVSDTGGYNNQLNIERIMKFDNSGTFITKWGTEGRDGGQFLNPEDVAVDNLGNVYVADYYNCRIQKFSPYNNIFYPGINWTAGDVFYKKIADELNAKRMDSYKGTDMFSGAMQVFLALQNIGTETNLLSNDSDSGDYNIAFAHSGGTRTLVKKIESRKVKANYVVLAAPALISQEELQELITNYGVKKIVVFQSDWDLLNLLHVTLVRDHLFNGRHAPAIMVELDHLPLGIILNYMIWGYPVSNPFILTFIDVDPQDSTDKFSNSFNLHSDVQMENINNLHYAVVDISPYLAQANQKLSVIPDPPETFWIGGSDRASAQLFTNWSKNQDGNLNIVVVNVQNNAGEQPMNMHRRLGTTMADSYKNSMYPFNGVIPDLKGLKQVQSSV